VSYWNQVAIDASVLDHTQPVAPETRVFGEQLGPVRTSRALAIVHLAVFDAVNAIAGRYESYSKLTRARPVTPTRAAIAQAARFDLSLAQALEPIPNGPAKSDGVELGRHAAVAILALRADDGYPADYEEPLLGTDFIPSDAPGKWRQDPVSRVPIALGAHWGKVKPFALKSGDQFRAPIPPSLESPEYATAYHEVKRLGGCGLDPAGCPGGPDGHQTPTDRTPGQTEIGIYWGYDGTPGFGGSATTL
jgi:hypothetical protein